MYEGQLTEEERMNNIDKENEILTYLHSIVDSADEYKSAWKLREEKEAKESRIRELAEEKRKYKEHPDLMLVWNPGKGDDIVYTISRWQDAEVCCNCSNVGSYRLAIDMNAPGVCRADIETTVGINKDILKVIELPYAHQFVNSCPVNEFADMYQS